MNKSSVALENTVTARVDTGYAHASGTTIRDKDWERVLEEMRLVEINWFSSNLFVQLSDKVQPVKDHIAKFYPSVTFESDKLDHYAVSLMLSQKSGREVAFGIGFLKEIMDIAGTGFSTEDLDADLAGAMGWNVQQALAAGLLINTNPATNSAYDEWRKIVEYLAGYGSQSQIDKGTGQKYLTGIKNKINPHYDGGGQALSGYFIYHGGGTPQIHSLSLLPEAPPQGVATPISIQFTWRWDGTTFVNLTHSSHGSISGAEVTEDGETYNRYTITWPNTSIGASENYGYGVSDFINIAAGSFTVTDKNFPSPPGNGLLWHSVPVTISNNITDELY
jgi:hypothetical protein